MPSLLGLVLLGLLEHGTPVAAPAAPQESPHFAPIREIEKRHVPPLLSDGGWSDAGRIEGQDAFRRAVPRPSNFSALRKPPVTTLLLFSFFFFFFS